MNAKGSTRKATPPSTRSARKTRPETTASRNQSPSVPNPNKTTKAAKPPATRRTKAAKPAVTVTRALPPDSPGTSKQARLITLLTKECGATLTQMMALTGWQAHSVRGTLSGVLRKRMGFNVICTLTPDSGERVYRIVGATASA